MAFGLSKFNAGEAIRRLELPDISVDPKTPLTLLVKHCGQANKAWDNYTFKRRGAARPPAPPEPVDRRAADRLDSATTLAETVIVGWENVFDDGQLVPWTQAAALRFLLELDEHCPDVWSRIVLFTTDVDNFRSVATDPVALGKG